MRRSFAATLFLLAGLLVVAPSAGAATPTCGGQPVTIDGSDGDYPSEGTEDGDVVLLSPWANTFDGLGGDDIICGGDGNDTIYGGDGNDTIYGDGGGDVLHGDDGDDHLRGGAQDDALHGGRGHDVLEGAEDADDLFGGDGNDQLKGGPGSYDMIWPGHGDDVTDGGPGSFDELSYSQSDVAGVSIDIPGQTAIGAGSDVFTRFEAYNGSRGDDRILGSGARDRVNGGGGADEVRLRGGADLYYSASFHNPATGGRVYAGPGDDQLHLHGPVTALGGRGSDDFQVYVGWPKVRGGAGPDIVHVANEARVSFRGNRGRDVLDARERNGAITVDLARHRGTLRGWSVQTVVGTRFADTLRGGRHGERLVGRGGNDVLVGRRGPDVLLGRSGWDKARGGPGNDRCRAEVRRSC